MARFFSFFESLKDWIKHGIKETENGTISVHLSFHFNESTQREEWSFHLQFLTSVYLILICRCSISVMIFYFPWLMGLLNMEMEKQIVTKFWIISSCTVCYVIQILWLTRRPQLLRGFICTYHFVVAPGSNPKQTHLRFLQFILLKLKL